MKVFVVANTVNGRSGLDKAVAEMLNNFHAEGVEVALINLVNKNHATPGFFIDPVIPRFYVWDLDVDSFSQGDLEWISRPGLGFELKIPFLDVQLSRRSVLNYKWLLKQQPSESDLIIFTHPIQPYIVENFGWKLRAKTVLQIHGNYEELHDLRPLLSKSRKAVNYIQIITPGMREGIEKIVPDASIVDIPNFYTHEAVVGEAPSKVFRLGFVGSFQMRKNQLGAIRFIYMVARKLGNDFPVELVFFGNEKNAYGSMVKDAVASLGISNKVRFAGVKATKEIYADVDAVLMLSTSEGFSYVMVEAAHHRKPLFVFDFDYGPKDFIRDRQNGFMSAWGDYDDLVEKFCHAVRNPILLNQVQESALFSIRSIFDRVAIVERYSSLVSELGQGSRELKEMVSVGKREVGFNVVGCFVSGNSIKLKIAVDSDFLDEKLEARLFHNGSSIREFQKFVLDETSEIIYEFLAGESLVGAHLYLRAIGKWFYVGTVVSNGSIIQNYEARSCLRATASDSIPLADIDHFGSGGALYLALPFRGGVAYVESEVSGKALPQSVHLMKSDMQHRQWVKLNGAALREVHIYGLFDQRYSVRLPEVSVGALSEHLSLIESELSLFQRSEAGVFWWELVRANVFDLIMEATLSWDRFTTSPEFYDVVTVPELDSLRVEQLKGFHRLVFSLPVARVNVQDDYWREHFRRMPDANRSAFVRYAPSKHVCVEHFIGESMANDFFVIPPATIEHIKVISKETKGIIGELVDQLKDRVGVRVVIDDLVRTKLNKFLTERDFYRQLFTRSEIREVCVPSAYWQPGLIQAALECEIKVCDLQYSAVVKNHPNYFVPYHQRNYRDDVLYLRQKSFDADELGCVRPIEFYGLKGIANTVRLPRFASPVAYGALFFISQGRLSAPIVRAALDASERYPEKLVALVLHPTETIMPSLLDRLERSRVTIFRGVQELQMIGGEWKSMDVLAVGVYSSALLDLYESEVDVAIMKLPGWDFYESWLKKGAFMHYEL